MSQDTGHMYIFLAKVISYIGAANAASLDLYQNIRSRRGVNKEVLENLRRSLAGTRLLADNTYQNKVHHMVDSTIILTNVLTPN